MVEVCDLLILPCVGLAAPGSSGEGLRASMLFGAGEFLHVPGLPGYVFDARMQHQRGKALTPAFKVKDL